MLDRILQLATIFRAHGKQLYMVGGTVRDLLLQRQTTLDADLTTDATPQEIKQLAAETHPSAMVLVGEQFGTVQLRYRRQGPSAEPGEAGAPNGVYEAAPAEDVIEITTFRTERYNPDSRKPEVGFGTVLEEDLLRRDFTTNAMARDPLTGAIIDPYGGRADLEAHLLRAVGNEPEKRFDEDPLRMLRAVRFAAQLDFTIEQQTAEAIVKQAQTLEKISRERIRDEMNKILLSPRPALGLRLMVDLGLMQWAIPEVLDLLGVSQRPGPAHSKDVYAHTLRVVENTPPRLVTRWAGLLHDIAKPRTRTVEDGKVHFFGHDEVGAYMARDILRRLKFDRDHIEQVSHLVRMHMRSNAYTSEWTDGAVRRLMLEMGDHLPDLLDLSQADITSYRPERVSRAVARVQDLRARAAYLKEEAERVPLKSPLDGVELMELFGRGPGPWLKPIKEHLLGLVIDGNLAPDDKAGAAKEARAFMEAHSELQLAGEQRGEGAGSARQT
jgi:poly(A) polymerase